MISLDRPAEQIVVRHHLPDHAPAHEMRGRHGSSILLGLLREGLVSQLGHAGYLGAELARAEAALRLGLRYAQDRPLRSDAAESAGEAAPERPRMTAPLDAEHLALTPAGGAVQVALRVEEVAAPGILACLLLEPAEPGSGPRSYRPSPTRVRARWDGATQLAMGAREDLVAGAVLRVQGELRERDLVMAERIAVLTKVVTVLTDRE